VYGDESLQEHLSKTGHHPAMAMMLVLFKLPEEHVMKSDAGHEQETTRTMRARASSMAGVDGHKFTF
jgi:hypothetical protein